MHPDDALFALLVRMTDDCLPEPEPVADWPEEDDWSDAADDDAFDPEGRP